MDSARRRKILFVATIRKQLQDCSSLFASSTTCFPPWALDKRHVMQDVRMPHRHKVQCTGVVRKSPACVQYYGKLKKVMANLHHMTNNVPQAKRSSALQPACWLVWCIGWRSGPLDEQTYRSCAVITRGRLTHIHKHTATITHTHTDVWQASRRKAEMIRAGMSSSSWLLTLGLQCLYCKHDEKDGSPPPLSFSFYSFSASDSSSLAQALLTCRKALESTKQVVVRDVYVGR